MIYVVRAGDSDLYKVGWTGGTTVKKRVQTLQTATAEKLRVVKSFPGTLDDEAALHARFADKQVKGGGSEFFRLTPEDLALIGHHGVDWIDGVAPYVVFSIVFVVVNVWLMVKILEWLFTVVSR